MKNSHSLRTWIEIDRKALRHNVEQFLKLIPRSTRFMAVVKSNAYGHGLALVAKLLSGYKLQSKSHKLIWFGVDSIVEALRLRREGIKNPILVLGSTLPSRLQEAKEHDIVLTVSNFEVLASLAKLKKRLPALPAQAGQAGPNFHIKIDTGMHRQGFLPQDVFKLIKLLKQLKLSPQGVFTHFASAKDVAYPTYTLNQLEKFQIAVSKFKKAGFGNLIKHAAASGGTLLFPQSHLDMVRIGMGLYGYWPSEESRTALEGRRNLYSSYRGFASIVLKPVLTWKTIISEIKEIPKGSYVGYDLTEKVSRTTKIAILPVGYWHGYDRGLSGAGEVLIKGKRAKVLGRVSMDMIVVDITDIDNKVKSQKSKVKTGDVAVLISRQGKDAIWADDLALKLGASHYEFLTRINPLIRREAV